VTIRREGDVKEEEEERENVKKRNESFGRNKVESPPKV